MPAADVLIGVVREDRDRKFVFMNGPTGHNTFCYSRKICFQRGTNLVVENADNADPSDMSFSFDPKVLKMVIIPIKTGQRSLTLATAI